MSKWCSAGAKKRVSSIRRDIDTRRDFVQADTRQDFVQTDERPGGKADVLADAFDSVKADQSRCPGSGVEKLRSQEN